MKQRDLKKALKKAGWTFLREGGNHEVWTNGKDVQAVPRHREVNENTAKGIIRMAQANPGEKK